MTRRRKTDVAILGGGFVGLWTAIFIKESWPGCDVTLLEQDVCGGGASGRSAGFVLSWRHEFESLLSLVGPDAARSIVRDSEKAVSEIGRFCASRKIDAQFCEAAWISAATSRPEAAEMARQFKIQRESSEEKIRKLGANEMRRATGSRAFDGGITDRSAATVHPGFLVRGLRRAALEMGVEIFENSRAVSFSRRKPIVIKTILGELAAKKIVIATNAWACSIPELSRAFFVTMNDMFITEPDRGPFLSMRPPPDTPISSLKPLLDYFRLTSDGRIVFGKARRSVFLGRVPTRAWDRNRARIPDLKAVLRGYYPRLGDFRVAGDWSGPIDSTWTRLPLMGRLKACPDVIYGVGWSGNGIGPSRLGGKILASLALDRSDRWSSYPLVQKIAL